MSTPIATSSSTSGSRLPLATTVLPPEIVAVLREGDVPDETIYLADEAASWAAALPAGERRALALVIVALLESRAEGSTRFALAAAGERLGRAGVTGPERDAAQTLADALARPRPPAALAPLFGGPGAHRPFIVEGGFLYAHRDWVAEERLADALAARLAGPSTSVDVVDDAALAAAVTAAALPGRRWTAEQEAALRAALRGPLAVVTGGPGTGKTALIAGMLRAFAELGIAGDEVAIAAPTGRAANRIAETLPAALGAAPRTAPRTLHRLLGFGGGGRGGGRDPLAAGEFRHHENHPLPHRVVLVDETSMVDLALMERLARAVRPDARLVLLGDADQLPSVDAGAVFRDLGGYAVRLTQSHRMSPSDPAGAAVLAAARAVRTGDLGPLPAPLGDPAAATFAGFEALEPDGASPGADRRLLAAFLDRWAADLVRALPGYDDLCARIYRLRPEGAAGAAAGPGASPLDDADAAALATLLAHHGRLRVLALTRGAGSPAGAEALNRALARRVAAASPGARAAAAAAGAEPAPGTPVLMSRNDYLRGLYNGDQGVVVRVGGAGGGRPRLAAAFPRGAGVGLYPFESLRHDLRVAYASTVHKAQGAELDHAALVLPERDIPLLSRELLYTALTRARRGVIVVGRRELLARGAARPLERASGLAGRLAARGRTPSAAMPSG